LLSFSIFVPYIVLFMVILFPFLPYFYDPITEKEKEKFALLQEAQERFKREENEWIQRSRKEIQEENNNEKKII